MDLLQRFSDLGTDPLYFILGAESGNGPCLAGVKTHKILNIDIRGKRRDHSLDGFRPGKLPKFLAMQRLFSDANPASRLKVERVDSPWIHGRGYDPHHKSLSVQTVVIIGCGSVGAPIAQHLAMAGVGRLDLVDPEVLSMGQCWSASVGSRACRRQQGGGTRSKASTKLSTTPRFAASVSPT